jgi:hypothetical protein
MVGLLTNIIHWVELQMVDRVLVFVKYIVCEAIIVWPNTSCLNNTIWKNTLEAMSKIQHP